MNLKDLQICLITSVLLALSFPPFPGGVLVPIAIALFLNHLTSKGPKTAFRMGYVMGFFWAVFTLFWIASNTVAGAALTVLINPLHYGIVWWLFVRIYRRNQSVGLWSFPVLWTAAEFLRHFSDLRFNWMNLAHTQTYYLPFIQFIEWTGYLGITLLLGYLSVFAYFVFYKKQHLLRNLIGLCVLVILPLIYGGVRLNALKKKNFSTLKVGVVQPNMDPFKKWDLQFQDSTFTILKNSTYRLNNTDLVVWPETATPFFLRYKPKYLFQIYHIVDSLNIYLITGTPDVKYLDNDDYITYNSAFFFSPNRHNFESYNKIALVPAAESMPFKKSLPFLRNLDVGGGDFFPGTEFKVFTMRVNLMENGIQLDSGMDSLAGSEVKVAAIICFDSVFPHIVRQFVKRGARILTIITNDAWFGETSGPYQHAQYAVLRAIENRVGIARSANTGISMFIDPSGRKHETVGLKKRAEITYELPVTHDMTFYTWYGEWLGILCLVVSLPVTIFGFIKKEQISS